MEAWKMATSPTPVKKSPLVRIRDCMDTNDTLTVRASIREKTGETVAEIETDGSFMGGRVYLDKDGILKLMTALHEILSR